KKDTGFIKVLCPAKINLFLHVTDKRSDGYHNLISLMCPVSLYDTLSITFNTSETKLVCEHPGVPEDNTNLAWRAAELFLRKADIREKLGIIIEKKIPVGGGLGGGSSNAASVLMALNTYYGNIFSCNMLMDMGLSLGADVPFFVFQKPAVATGIGEKLEVYEGFDNFYVVLIAFDFIVSTANVYKNLNLGLTKCKKINKGSSFKELGFNLEQHLCNDLEMVSAFDYPDINVAKKALLDHDAKGVLMSGSGPSVFGLFSDLYQAEKAIKSLSKNERWTLYLADLII
ncbi:4-(cytidine 5'-diphospho)-2-C-methyl-D-erythritol kinase, partial [Desulfobacterales bacterium HSG17]|nr:4-(cytidine 5'-diphospho)-2-C-methyl-D-erythritol kinase [Desulfobacterales bacterium HSG17]